MYCCRYSIYHIYYVKFIQRTYLPILYILSLLWIQYMWHILSIFYQNPHIRYIYIYMFNIYIYMSNIYIYIAYILFISYILYIYVYIYIYIHHTYTLYYIKITKETIPPATIGLAAEKTTPPLPQGGGTIWLGGGGCGGPCSYIHIYTYNYVFPLLYLLLL